MMMMEKVRSFGTFLTKPSREREGFSSSPDPEAMKAKNRQVQSSLFIVIFLLFIDRTSTERRKLLFDETFLNDHRYSIDDCIPLAFGDFNADRIIDIFCRNTNGDTLRVMINDDRSTDVHEQCHLQISGIIHDAIVADFDGDTHLDAFLLYKTRRDQPAYFGGFLWGNRKNWTVLHPLDFTFQSTPTPLDANGDSYVDLLGMISFDGEMFQPICLTLRNRTIFNVIHLTDIPPLLIDSTQATVDLNDDLVADLFVTTNHFNRPKFAVYQLPLTDLTLIDQYAPPADVTLVHLSRFADIDADGAVEHLLPVCMDIDCIDSRIYIRKHDQWFQIPIEFGDDLRFPLHHELPSPFDQVPLSVRIADYNLDGFPDMAILLTQISTGATVPIILENRRCDSMKNISCTFNRTFVIRTGEEFLFQATNSALVVFFDLLENGYPDLLIVQRNQTTNFSLIAFQNSLYQDVHFFKVMVLSTFTCNTCSHQDRLPYGNNQPGQSIKMETITTGDGIKDSWIQLAAVQMSQAGQLTLELPYAIIGLGATPNFVEKLTIGIPPNAHSRHLIRSYRQMIPNSQVVVIPSPLMDPERWETKLFLTPSRMIVHTGIALGGTLIVLLFVMIILHCREKREDDRQRKEQSQSFHYDAL